MFVADMTASCNQEFCLRLTTEIAFLIFFVVSVAFEVLLFHFCKNHDLLANTISM